MRSVLCLCPASTYSAHFPWNSPERKVAQPLSIHRHSAALVARKFHTASQRPQTPETVPDGQFHHGGAGAGAGPASPPVEPERLLPMRLLPMRLAAPPLLRPPPPRCCCPLRGRLQGHAQGDGLLGTRGKGFGSRHVWVLSSSLVCVTCTREMI